MEGTDTMLDVLFDENRRKDIQSCLQKGTEIEFRKSRPQADTAGFLSDGEFMPRMGSFLRPPNASRVVYCPKCGKSALRGSACSNPACRTMIY